MKKLIPAILGLIILSLTFWGTKGVNTSLDTFMTTNMFFGVTRLVLAGFLVVCSLLAYLKHDYALTLLKFAGIVFMAVGVISICSPTFFGRFPSYTLILDTLVAIEGGIVCILASLKPATGPRAAKTRLFVFRPNRHVLSKQAAQVSFHAGRMYTPAH